VREGDRVDRGQEIAFLGGTGQATAPHLHFEVWKNGAALDPRLVMTGDPAR
jgi:murein DD-endopeptidase MepM/ murein hydrolase activator NlpD